MAGLIDGWKKFFSVGSGVLTGSYDATSGNGRRRSPPQATAAEDAHADDRRRLLLTANARDLARNWTLASWMIRKHLDFVADFSFRATTPDRGFNREFEQWWAEASKPYSFDVSGRHSQRRAVRLAEACRVIDGDVFWLKLMGGANRGKIQAIESDRIYMPGTGIPLGQTPEDWVNGVRVDQKTGKAMAYAICNRVNRTGRELDRVVSATSIIPHAAYEFRYDQVRGISPITSALNQMRDVYELVDYTLAKAKVASLFGLQIKTESVDSGPFPGAGTAEYTEDTDGDGEADAGPRIQLGKGPFISELEPGESIETVESKTPSTETVAFMQLLMQLSLRALDLPFSFLSEDFTNFFGSRAALIHYLLSCDSKVADLQCMQNSHCKWRAGIDVTDGVLQLPSGKDFDFLSWEFQPGGMPWWNPTQEATGAAMSIAMGVTSPQQVCKELGRDFERNIDEIAEAMDYAKSKGVELTYAKSTAFNPSISVSNSDESNNQPKK